MWISTLSFGAFFRCRSCCGLCLQAAPCLVCRAVLKYTNWRSRPPWLQVPQLALRCQPGPRDAQDQDAQFAKTKESKRTQQLSHEKTKAMNQQEMTVKKNDLAVFDFIMDITKCGKQGAFLQLGNTTEPVQVCETEDSRRIP